MKRGGSGKSANKCGKLDGSHPKFARNYRCHLPWPNPVQFLLFSPLSYGLLLSALICRLKPTLLFVE